MKGNIISKSSEIRAKVDRQFRCCRFIVQVLKMRGLDVHMNWGYARLGTALTGQALSHKAAVVAMLKFYDENHNNKADAFYNGKAWLELRYRALVRYGRVCSCCGSLSGPFHVDHIKPRSRYPKLALDIENLQVLCKDCNVGKSNKDSTDFR